PSGRGSWLARPARHRGHVHETGPGRPTHLERPRTSLPTLKRPPTRTCSPVPATPPRESHGPLLRRTPAGAARRGRCPLHARSRREPAGTPLPTSRRLTGLCPVEDLTQHRRAFRPATLRER